MCALIDKDILDFWFSDVARPLHFQKNIDFDKEIRHQFSAIYKQAMAGELDNWQKTAESSLALIIILDQFSRNMFRDSPEAFAADSKALEISKMAIKNNFDSQLTKEQLIFLYMPLMHSESLADQDLSVELYGTLQSENSLKFAIAHLDIIKVFGRFPHRNEVLGRKSTKEEIEFLKQPNSGF